MIDKAKVKEKMAIFLKQPIASLQDSVLLTDLVQDSFILVEMVIQLQEEFGTQFMQEDLRDVKTVGNLLKLFESRL